MAKLADRLAKLEGASAPVGDLRSMTDRRLLQVIARGLTAEDVPPAVLERFRACTPTDDDLLLVAQG